jgi:hypothetical protein
VCEAQLAWAAGSRESELFGPPDDDQRARTAAAEQRQRNSDSGAAAAEAGNCTSKPEAVTRIRDQRGDLIAAVDVCKDPDGLLARRARLVKLYAAELHADEPLCKARLLIDALMQHEIASPFLQMGMQDDRHASAPSPSWELRPRHAASIETERVRCVRSLLSDRRYRFEQILVQI